MERAAVLIGIKKTGDLPALPAAWDGAREMAAWARSQGMPDNNIKVLTDENNPVRFHQITDMIEELVNRTTIEQLIVYFAGHGIQNRGEYWLLSNAPDNSNEAVNLESSIILGRYCGIPHIVLISDACRTAADGIQAQHVRGGEIFPNDPASGLELPVDVFFACARGKPSMEVRDPNISAGNYTAVYTDTFLECLKGWHNDVLENVTIGGKQLALVRPWELKKFLTKTVPVRLKKMLGRMPKINQTPDARINSHDTWLAKILTGDIPPISDAISDELPDDIARAATMVTPHSASGGLLSVALEGEVSRWKSLRTETIPLAGSPSIETVELSNTINTLSVPFGPGHFETQCGIKIRGSRIERVVSKAIRSEIVDDERSIVRLYPASDMAACVLVVMRNGTGVIVPAIPNFIAALTFEDDELVDMSFEPSDNSWRWNEYTAHAEELRALRASIAASVGFGIFHLEGDDPVKLARRMQVSKGVDPSLALYAAYAYHEQQRRNLISEMSHYLYDDLGFVFFDIALLDGNLTGPVAPGGDVLPYFPMLSQGWPLLSAYRANPGGALQGIERHLLSSLWSVFDRNGVAILEEAIQTEEIR